MKKKCIYLASGCAILHNDYIDIFYNDIMFPRDYCCDMLEVELNCFDFLIATPPCNYWSRANHFLDSDYSVKTKHLLPDIIFKFIHSGKPFIVENVINYKRMSYFLVKLPPHIYYYTHGRHCYITNVELPEIHSIPQILNEFKGYRYRGLPMNRQGGPNVNLVLEYFLNKCLDLCHEVRT